MDTTTSLSLSLSLLLYLVLLPQRKFPTRLFSFFLHLFFSVGPLVSLSRAHTTHFPPPPLKECNRFPPKVLLSLSLSL